jgi:hypothetical protein
MFSNPSSQELGFSFGRQYRILGCWPEIQDGRHRMKARAGWSRPDLNRGQETVVSSTPLSDKVQDGFTRDHAVASTVPAIRLYRS